MNQVEYVLLDRDGVVNQDSDDFIKSPQEWQPIPRSIEAISLLNQHGYKIIIITNQSGLQRGLFDLDTLRQIHAKMCRLVEKQGGKIEAIYFCPHGPDDDCCCRKPKPGLLQKFSKDYNTKLDNIFFIGDSLKDIQAGKSVGAEMLLVKTGKGCRTLQDNPGLNVPVFEDLYDAAKFIISRK